MEMMKATKKWDTTRPFSANMNQVGAMPAMGPESPSNWTAKYLAAHLDVEGFSHGRIEGPGTAHIFDENRGKAFVSSECCSCKSQRGEDFSNRTAGISYPHVESQASCMQTCMAKSYPCWPNASTCAAPDQLGYPGTVAGTLGVWTLFDYGGEPGPWPLVSSSFGQFDYAGFAKSAAYWYRALWLYGVDTADVGRPPLPAGHVVRISQAWSKPGPRPSLPAGCNATALEHTCPNSAAYETCLSCMRQANTDKKIPHCSGTDVWPSCKNLEHG